MTGTTNQRDEFVQTILYLFTAVSGVALGLVVFAVSMWLTVVDGPGIQTIYGVAMGLLAVGFAVWGRVCWRDFVATRENESVI